MQQAGDPFATFQQGAKTHLVAEVPDVIPPTLVERLLAALEREYGPVPPARPRTGADIRRACRFCLGRGCLDCDTRVQAEYTRQFPHGPAMLASFCLDDPEDRALVHALLQATTANDLMRRLAEAIQQQACLHRGDRETMP
jgi:hypothetical protein